MFEVNLFTPEQFGAFVSWLVVWRGPLSVLIHPNTGEDVRDHSQRATWLVLFVSLLLLSQWLMVAVVDADCEGRMGQPLPLDIGLLREITRRENNEV